MSDESIPIPPHIGGAYEQGDGNTIMPDVWGYLIVKHNIKSMLDIGCGYGHAVKWFSQFLVHSIGIDGDPNCIAKSQLPGHTFLHDFTIGPVSTTVIKPTDYYDLAWSAEFLEHVEEQYMPYYMEAFRHCRFACVTHAEPGQHGHHHVNCVVEGTNVLADDIHSASRRRYVGDVVTIVTAFGNRLTVTPNHPILTQRGWVPANLLNDGDNLVSRDFQHRKVSPEMANQNQRPTKVEQVFDSILKMEKSISIKMPITAEDFHGDGRDGYVDTVRPYRLLGSKCQSSFSEPRLHHEFEVGSFGTGSLSGDGALAFCSQIISTHESLSAGHSLIQRGVVPSLPLGGVSGDYQSIFSKRLVNRFRTATHLHSNLAYCHPRVIQRGRFLKRNSLSSKHDRLGLASDLNAAPYQHLFCVPEVNVRGLGKSGETFAGQVSRDKIRSISLSNFDGYVFNLHTSNNWYFANNIITHNCQDDEYWVQAFAEAGFIHEPKETEILRMTDRWSASWGRRTLMFFRRL